MSDELEALIVILRKYVGEIMIKSDERILFTHNNNFEGKKTATIFEAKMVEDGKIGIRCEEASCKVLGGIGFNTKMIVPEEIEGILDRWHFERKQGAELHEQMSLF